MIQMITQQQHNKMLVKLNEMYDREAELQELMLKLKTEWEQLQEDKELLQTMIMHQANTFDREKKKNVWKQ